MFYSVNGYKFDPIFSTFPGGEEYVRVSKLQHPMGIDGTVTIHAHIKSSKNVMQLLMLHDALVRKIPNATFKLDMPYLPYARQDRVCARGESFSLKVFCNLINSMGFSEVRILDCHSPVGTALLNNVVEVNQLQVAEEAAASVEGYEIFRNLDAIVAPDAGATKKAQEIADSWELPLIQCLKQRIDDRIQIKVCEDITNLKLLVVDDIIDGGGTFVALADALRDAKSKKLYATHGIFSKGKEHLTSLYDEVFVYSDWTKNGN